MSEKKIDPYKLIETLPAEHARAVGVAARCEARAEEAAQGRDVNARSPQPRRSVAGQLDYEKRVIDVAREALSDIPECRDATYRVRWTENAAVSAEAHPLLIIAFPSLNPRAQPCVGVGLITVQKGTLLVPTPNATFLEGDRLRDHILRSVHKYFAVNGLALAMPLTQH